MTAASTTAASKHNGNIKCGIDPLTRVPSDIIVESPAAQIVSDRARGTSPDREYFHQRHTRNKSADVSGICHAAAAGRRKRAEDHLVNDPDTDRDKCGDGREKIKQYCPDR